MLDTVWRVKECNFDILNYIENFKIKNVNTTFVQGEEGRPGKVNEHSGFNVSISSNENSKENVNEIENFIHENEKALSYLLKKGFKSSIDIGCSLDETSFTKSINISSNLLGLLNRG